MKNIYGIRMVKIITLFTLLFYFRSFSAVLASFFLNESLGSEGKIGCALCIIGSIVIILHSPEEKVINSVDEILSYAIQPGMFRNANFCFFFFKVI